MRMSLMQTVLNVSERAARIARLIRQEPYLFSLLVEEKGEADKNKRFMQDFKTLADVLIQETVRYYVSMKFPQVAEHIYGEENSTFTNTLGEKITVSVSKDISKTSELLSKVLDGDRRAANLLAERVHEPMKNVSIESSLLTKLPKIDCNDVGIWIDPIDSTGEYISGKSKVVHPESNAHEKGLECVTVLIGLYERTSGNAIGGVVTQPFGYETPAGWQSITYWGLKYDRQCVHSSNLSDRTDSGSKYIVLSSNEDSQIRESLSNKFSMFNATGAGYKSLVTALNLAEAYVCTKGSTYQWDTAAPHALLRSLGGGIISYERLLNLGRDQLLNDWKVLDENQILYNKEDPNYEGIKAWCNNHGIVAYRDPSRLQEVYDCVRHIH